MNNGVFDWLQYLLSFALVIALLLGYRLVCRWREHQASHQPG